MEGGRTEIKRSKGKSTVDGGGVSGPSQTRTWKLLVAGVHVSGGGVLFSRDIMLAAGADCRLCLWRRKL